MRPMIILMGGAVIAGAVALFSRDANAATPAALPEPQPDNPNNNKETTVVAVKEDDDGNIVVEKTPIEVLPKADPTQGVENVYDKTLPKADQARIFDLWRVALLSGDPDKLEKVAPELSRVAGPEAAKDALALAAEWRKAKAAGAETSAVKVTETKNAIVIEAAPKPAPATQIVQAQPVQSQPTEQPGRALAQELALMLKVSRKGTENRGLVEKFERANGIVPGSGKYGLYGIAVATVLATKYGIVPPKTPFYWGIANDYASVQKQKDQYRALMNLQAEKDPSRKAEWLGAAMMK